MTQTKLLLAGALSAALVFAQGPRGPHGAPPDPQSMVQRRVGFLTNSLSLTEDQKAKASTIFAAAFTTGQNIRASERANRQSLAEAIKKNDTAAIDQLSAAAGTLSGQLTAIEAKANAAVYAMLTTDQQARLDALPHGRSRFGGVGPAGLGR